MATQQDYILKFSADTGNVNSAIKDVQTGVAGTSAAVTGLAGQLDKMTGGAISGFRNLTGGIKNGVTGLKSFKVALAATGIGLLVVAIGSLITAFKSSEEGANKLSKILAVIGSVTDNLLDVVADLGEKLIWAFENPQEALSNFAGLIKENIVNRFEGLIELIPKLGEAIGLLFEFKFAEAGKVAADAVGKVALGIENVTDVVNTATDAVVRFANEIAEEGKIAATIADKRARANKLERELLVERAKLESEIAALRLKSRQEEEFSAEERRQALLDAQELEDQLLVKETEVLTLRRDAQIEENKLARSTIENLDKEANAIAAVSRQEAARLNQQRQTQRELNRLNKEIQTAEDARLKAERDALQKEQEEKTKLVDELFKLSLSGYDAEEQALLALYDQRIAIAGDDEGLIRKATEQLQSDLSDLDEKYTKEEVARNKTLFDSRVAYATSALNALAQLNDAFSGDSEKEQERAFKRNKAIGIATAIVNTAGAIIGAINPAVGGLGIPAGLPGAAIAAATGAAQIATIMKSQFQGGSGSAPDAPSRTIEQPSPTAPQLDLGFLGGGAGQTGFRTYVVSSEVSNAQQANQRINDQASLVG